MDKPWGGFDKANESREVRQLLESIKSSLSEIKQFSSSYKAEIAKLKTAYMDNLDDLKSEYDKVTNIIRGSHDAQIKRFDKEIAKLTADYKNTRGKGSRAKKQDIKQQIQDAIDKREQTRQERDTLIAQETAQYNASVQSATKGYDDSVAATTQRYKNLIKKESTNVISKRSKISDSTEDDLAKRSNKFYAAMFRGQFKDGKVPMHVEAGAAAMQAQDKFIKKLTQAFAPLFNKLGKATSQFGRLVMLKGLSDFNNGNRLQGFAEMLGGLLVTMLPAITTFITTFLGSLLKDVLLKKDAKFGKLISDLFNKGGKGGAGVFSKMSPIFGLLGRTLVFLGGIYSIIDGVADLFNKNSDALTKILSIMGILGGVALLVGAFVGGVPLLVGGIVTAIVAGFKWWRDRFGGGKSGKELHGRSGAPAGTPDINHVVYKQDQDFATQLVTSAKSVAADMNTVGRCYAGVSKAVRAVDPTINLTGESAYMAADQLANSKRFQEVSVDAKSVKNLPAGSIYVLGKSDKHKHGHIAVLGGDGTEYSDHSQKIIKNMSEYGGVRAFVPVDKTEFKATSPSFTTYNANEAQESTVNQNVEQKQEANKQIRDAIRANQYQGMYSVPPSQIQETGKNELNSIYMQNNIGGTAYTLTGN